MRSPDVSPAGFYGKWHQQPSPGANSYFLAFFKMLFLKDFFCRQSETGHGSRLAITDFDT